MHDWMQDLQFVISDSKSLFESLNCLIILSFLLTSFWTNKGFLNWSEYLLFLVEAGPGARVEFLSL